MRELEDEVVSRKDEKRKECMEALAKKNIHTQDYEDIKVIE
jgi:hypothetical protein